MFTVDQKVVPYKMMVPVSLWDILWDWMAFGSECLVNTLGRRPVYGVKALGSLMPDVMQPQALIGP